MSSVVGFTGMVFNRVRGNENVVFVVVMVVLAWAGFTRLFLDNR